MPQTGRRLIERAPRALLLIALQMNSGRLASTNIAWRSGLKHLVAVVALLALALSCHSPATRREHLSDSARAREVADVMRQESLFVAAAPPCVLPAPPETAGWRPAPSAGRLWFSLPPGFREDTAVHSEHGGLRWTDGRRTFEIPNGYWGPSSFSPNQRCRAKLAGHQLLVLRSVDSARSRVTLTAWPLDSANAWGRFSTFGQLYSGGGSDAEDERVFWQVFRNVFATRAP